MKFSSMAILSLGAIVSMTRVCPTLSHPIDVTPSELHSESSSDTTTVTSRNLVGDEYPIGACFCSVDNVCISSTEDATDNADQDVLERRLCLWPNNADFSFLSLEDLFLVKDDFTLPILPSEDVTVDCTPSGTTCAVDIVLPVELTTNNDGDESLIVRGTALLTNTTAIDEQSPNVVEFEIAVNTNMGKSKGISVEALYLISGMAVLLQTTFFLIRYSYRRAKNNLPY